MENQSLVKPPAKIQASDNIDRFLVQRKEFIEKVNAICVEGKDYHVIQGRKSLAKGGAEKIASIFQWTATFQKDTQSLEMLGANPGLVAYKCVLKKDSEFCGEGRGAAILAKNSGDPNKTLKMAEKSAFIDAVIRASGLSDFFTQDLEDMGSLPQSHHSSNFAPVSVKHIEGHSSPFRQASVAQRRFIGTLAQQKGEIVPTIEDLEKLSIEQAKKEIDRLLKIPSRTWDDVKNEQLTK